MVISTFIVSCTPKINVRKENSKERNISGLFFFSSNLKSLYNHHQVFCSAKFSIQYPQLFKTTLPVDWRNTVETEFKEARSREKGMSGPNRAWWSYSQAHTTNRKGRLWGETLTTLTRELMLILILIYWCEDNELWSSSEP